MIFENNGLLQNATAEIIEVEIALLGISLEHLVRPIVEADVYELAQKDERLWEPIEIRLWPSEWEKPSPEVLYHVVSGNHRVSAARIKHVRTLKARLVDASNEREYLITAIKSNVQHGKNFTKEEYIANAKKLQEHGMSVTDIASVLGYNKSTVSRWFTGADSNASKKQDIEPVINESDMPVSRDTEIGQEKRKVMGLLMDAQIKVDAVSAQLYIRTLKPEQQELLRTLMGWLQDVMGGDYE